MAKKRNPWDVIGDAVSGAGHSASHAGGGGGGNSGGGAVGAASGGAASVSGGVGAATGTSTGYSSAAAGVSSVSSGVGTATGTRPTAPTPTYSPYTSRSTTTVNLKPLMGTITDPATRALASSAISAGLKYEVNPSLLIASAAVTDYGRAGKGKGYTNLGDGSETGAKSIRQAAKYLSEVGFHTNPQQAISALAKRTGADPEQLRKVASGYTALDEAARKIEHADGDTNVTGVGYFKYRQPGDRPGVRAAINAATKTGQAATKAIQGQAAAARAGSPVNTENSRERVPANAPGERGTAIAQATANAAKGTAALSAALAGQPQGPNPRKVATRLVRATNRATPEITGGLTDPNQIAFATELAKRSGLSPKLAAAAVLREGGNGTGDNNWLNIGWFDSGPDPVITTDKRWSDPVTAAKLTADFLKGKEFGASEGIQNIYRVAQAGGSDAQVARAWANSGWASAGAGPGETLSQISVAPGKDIPKQLVQRGYDVLGREATKAILNGGKLVKAPKGGVKKVRFDGRYAGSQDVVRYLVGTRVKGDHGGTKNGEAPGVHSATGDHYRADGYAQDINGTSPGENEPAYDQGTLDTIVANLRKGGATMADGSPIPDIQIGENIDGAVMGKYSIQVLTNEGGTINHIHVGAHPTDGSGGGSAQAPLIPIKGTNLAVKPPAPTTTGGGLSTAGTVATGTGSPAASLAAATNAAAKAQAAGASIPRSSAAEYARGSGSLASTAAAYARKSLTGDTTGDPIYDAFRPRR